MKSEEIKKLADTERDLAIANLHRLFKFDEDIRCDGIVDVVDHIIQASTLRTIEYQAEALERDGDDAKRSRFAELKDKLMSDPETDWQDAYMAEQQACVDALSRLDDAEDKIKELKAKIKELESKAGA